MMILFDDDYILKTYVADEKKGSCQRNCKESFSTGRFCKDYCKFPEGVRKKVEEWVGLVAI